MLAALLCLPALSVALADDFAGDSELPASVRSVLQVRDLPADSLSIYVEDLQTGEVLLRWRDDEPRNPASTVKLLTTLVALDTLGQPTAGKPTCM